MEEIATLTTVVRHHLITDRTLLFLGHNQSNIYVVCAMDKEEL